MNTDPGVPIIPGDPATPVYRRKRSITDPSDSEVQSSWHVHPLSASVAGVGIVALLVGLLLFTASRNQTPVAIASPSPSPSPVIQYVEVPVTVDTTEATTTSTMITDGAWTIGVDFPAGKYRTTSPVDPNCYWEIDKSGTNGGTIINNDIPGGGRPTVTLKAGQDFRTRDCGTWTKSS